MAEFQSHINQSLKNLDFLSKISQTIENSWDWQVTCAYYTAVHLVNAHIAKVGNLHYTSHEKVKRALYEPLSLAKIDQQVYLDYVKLENLSRRSRYICKDADRVPETDSTFLTHSVHAKRAFSKLDTLLTYFDSMYNLGIGNYKIKCPDLVGSNLTYFTIVTVNQVEASKSD